LSPWKLKFKLYFKISLEIKKKFLKPIKRILKYLPLKARGVPEASTPGQAELCDGLYKVGCGGTGETDGSLRLRKVSGRRTPAQRAEGPPSRGPSGAPW